MDNKKNKFTKILLGAAVTVVFLLGVVFRFYRIFNDDFFFYDEGYYLNLHLHMLEVLASHIPFSFSDFLKAVYLCLCFALREGKALYFFISHLRIFWGGLEQWYFPHVVSAVFGVLTLAMVYPFAKKILNSSVAGILSVCLLCVLPSHVFYSRLALQEAMCTFFFVTGFYFYLFPYRFGIRTFISSIFFMLAYFSNYRLVVIPVLVLFVEGYTSLSQGRLPNIRKYFWHTLTFTFLFLMIGSINQGQHIISIFSWIFHQKDLAEGTFSFFNLLSYPYYLFRLEGILFGVLFFANLYYIFMRQWSKLFPFLFVCFYMLLFSFTAEKGARYLCVVLPFMVIAISGLLYDFFQEQKKIASEYIVTILSALLILNLSLNSSHVMKFNSDYKTSIQYLQTINPHPKIASTQPWIQNLYVPQRQDVVECPPVYESLVKLNKEGVRYLILCPQAFVSFTQDGKKFSEPLKDYLQFVDGYIPPLKTFSHFTGKLLERFVFEHSEDLHQSLSFLNSKNPHKGELRIYDINVCIYAVNQANSLKQTYRANLK